MSKKNITPGTKYQGSKDAEKMTPEDGFEAPECFYKISAAKLTEILTESGLVGSHSTLSQLFTELKQYEDYSVLNKPVREKKLTREKKHQTVAPFKEKIVNALFWIPSKERYEYLRIRLAPSNIKEAGIGAFSVDKIPKGAKGVYKGVSKREKDANMYYAWVVKSYDSKTGIPDDDDDPTYYVDASDLKTSNWTRYVNCGMKNSINNFEPDQIYDKFFYVALRDIKRDEELWVDYGPDYRNDNLGMKGKY